MKTIASLLLAAAMSTLSFGEEDKRRPDVVEWANDASSEQLQECPGIGPALASRIIAARPFKDLSAVDAVKGIGPALMLKIIKHVDGVQF